MIRIRLTIAFAGLTLLAGLSGCAERTSSNDKPSPARSETAKAKAKEPKTVTVPVTKTDPDPAYAVKESAEVDNDTYLEGVLGAIHITAKSTLAPCIADENDCRGGWHYHLLSARLHFKDGGSLKCEEYKEWAWMEDDVYEVVDLRCNKKLKLSNVASVEMVP